MKINLIVIGFLVFLFTSCGMDNKSTTPSAKAALMIEKVGDANGLLNQEDMKEGEIVLDRKEALDILEHRIKESGKKSFTIIEKDLWVFDGIVKNSQMLIGDSLQGRWIDFKEDLTYDYGRKENKEGSGRYFFDFDKSILLMLDDNEGIKPQEFEVKLRNDMLVIVGMFTYDDNNMQAKLTRAEKAPGK